jgi:glyoxylase-like metal-dependent hydrolase (beta-lactamase superfamily II)
MMLEIAAFTLGLVETNTYLIADPVTKEAIVIDPADEGHRIVTAAQQRGWRLGSIWLTHAHFDHIAGAAAVADLVDPPPPVAMHAEDYPLWRIQGGAAFFGMRIDPGPEPTIELHHGQMLHVGRHLIEVRHTPGHTRGHVIFYCADEKLAFCGDVMFQGSIGRTDLPGGDYQTLINSIQTQILSLPDDTRLLCGHGAETSVGRERKWNPYLA